MAKELNKKNYKSNGKKQIKAKGINGKKIGYGFGDIIDLDNAINKWLKFNQDVIIIDIKVVPMSDHYDAMILYEEK